MNRILLYSVTSALGMLVLILDTPTAIQAGRDAMELCLKTVIPTLYPFFLLSSLLSGSLLGASGGLLNTLEKYLFMPRGSGSLFLTGILGGYPTGAKAVTNAYAAGGLSKKDAHRLLGFCSNAGPSFLFGILGPQFTSGETVFALWLIHILSALLTGAFLPAGDKNTAVIKRRCPSLFQSFRQSLYTTAQVCGWILLFRIFYSYCTRWLLWLLPQGGRIFIAGILELTLGAVEMRVFPGECFRFFAASVLLAQGGLCVAMQTASVTQGLGLGAYLPGKALQTVIVVILSWLYLFLTGGLCASVAGSLLAMLGIVALCAEGIWLRNYMKKRGGNLLKLRV